MKTAYEYSENVCPFCPFWIIEQRLRRHQSTSHAAMKHSWLQRSILIPFTSLTIVDEKNLHKCNFFWRKCPSPPAMGYHVSGWQAVCALLFVWPATLLANLTAVSTALWCVTWSTIESFSASAAVIWRPVRQTWQPVSLCASKKNNKKNITGWEKEVVFQILMYCIFFLNSYYESWW